MIDFERRKEKNILNPLIQKEDSILTTEQTKILYDMAIRNENQIKKIEKDINILKYQIYDILNNYNKEYLHKKEENIKDELYNYINKEIKIQIKEQFKLFTTNNINSEININNINKQLINQENSIVSLNANKINKNEFNEQMVLINERIDKLNNNFFMKINKVNNIDCIINEDDIMEKKNIFNQDDLNKIKKEMCLDFEKVNLRILNELKNQASDIKTIYQEIQNINIKNIKNNIINNDFNNDSIENTEEDLYSENINNSNINNINNLIYFIKSELSKKVNLDQLNYALKTQAKLNEALTSSFKICRLCWDSDSNLINNIYIQWSSENINTALDVFKWENNPEIITILQKGVYKIVVGLIGLESNKNIIIFYDENSIGKKYDNDNDNIIFNNDKGNIKFIEKYFACVENTKIKVALFDENNNRDFSEEAFLEIEKII